MKGDKKIGRFPGTVAKLTLAVCAAAACVYSNGAEIPPKDVSKEIGKLRAAVVSAVVWLAPKYLESRSELTEGDLRRYGCSYAATEQRDLDSLLDILTSAGFVESAKAEGEDLRIAVYLKTRANAVVPLLFGSESEDSPSTGRYRGDTPVTARQGFEEELRRWAWLRKSTKATCAREK